MFRFTIRDVLWLVALGAMGAGWWADHNMLRGVIRTQSDRFANHVSQEHPGQAEYERLLSEWTSKSQPVDVIR